MSCSVSRDWVMSAIWEHPSLVGWVEIPFDVELLKPGSHHLMLPHLLGNILGLWSSGSVDRCVSC